MDRHAFLDCLPYLRPCGREPPLAAPVWTGSASLSLSLAEQYAPLQDAPHSSPLGASADDAQWLFFAVDERSQDATQLRAEMHVGATGEVTLVLDGRAYVVQGHSIRHISARVPESGTLPPYVTLLFARVSLTLVPAPGRAWAVEAPLLLAAANHLERARAVALSAPQAPAAEDAAALAADAESALLRWREAVGMLAAAAKSSGSVVQAAAATELLAAATETLRGAADAGALAGVREHAHAELGAAFAAAYPASHGPVADAEGRLALALERMDGSSAAELAAALAPA